MPKRIDFKGLFTNADPQDVPEGYLQTAENVVFTKPGVASKRPPRSKSISHPTGTIRSLYRFVNEDMPGGAVWIALINYQTHSAIEWLNPTTNNWVTVYGDIRITPDPLVLSSIQNIQDIPYQINITKFNPEALPGSASAGAGYYVPPPYFKIQSGGVTTLKHCPRPLVMDVTINAPKPSIKSHISMAAALIMTNAYKAPSFKNKHTPSAISGTYSIPTPSIKLTNSPSAISGKCTVPAPTVTIT